MWHWAEKCDIDDSRNDFSFLLLFSEARARIIGPADVYVKTGSLLTLTCLMSQGPHDLGTVAWFHGGKPVLTSTREGNDVALEPRVAVDTEWSDALTSRYVYMWLWLFPPLYVIPNNNIIQSWFPWTLFSYDITFNWDPLPALRHIASNLLSAKRYFTPSKTKTLQGSFFFCI